MMLLVAIVAALLGGPKAIERLHQHFILRANFPSLMAGLCGNESSIFSERAATCRSLASNGIPWNQEGEDLEILRLCPHQLQEPEHGSWTQQAEGWEQAAETANRASVRHGWTASLYLLWGYWPAVSPLSFVLLLVLSWFFIGRLDRSRSGESTSRWSRIALLLIVLGILTWMFGDGLLQSWFWEARE